VNNEELALKLLEPLREIHKKLNAVYELTNLEVFEYFRELDDVYRAIICLLGGEINDFTIDTMIDYLDGKIEFDELIRQIRLMRKG
jgi:hypothetical protein